mgnify:CR=1 FL=1
MESQIAILQQLIDNSHYTVVISGAGISVSTGIPDMFHLNMADTFQFMSTALLKNAPNHYLKIAKKLFLDFMFIHGPSPAHRKLAELEENGKIQGIITTNLDSMHTLAGSKNVAEIQGSFGVNKCLKCEKRHDDVHIWNKGSAPKCECGGAICCFPVYSHVGLFNEAVPKARSWISKAELVIVIGAKGNYGGVYWDYLKSNTTIVQVNPEHTQFDNIAKINIREGADEVIRKMI